MKLITKELEKKLPPLGTTTLSDNIKVKLFTPDSDFTWYIMEYDKDTKKAYGATENRHGIELGYFSIKELEAIRGPWGLPIERDMYFNEQPLSNFVKFNKEEEKEEQSTTHKRRR